MSFENRLPSLKLVRVLLLAKIRLRSHPAMRHGAIRVHPARRFEQQSLVCGGLVQEATGNIAITTN